MGGVDHHHIHPGGNQCLNALIGTGTHPNRRTDAQVPQIVLAGIGFFGGLVDILDGDQTTQAKGIVHHQNLFDPVFMQQTQNGVTIRALLDRHKLVLGGHDAGDWCIVTGFKTHIAVGHDPDQIVAINHRHPGDPLGTGQFQYVTDGGGWMDGDRVLDHAAFIFLDLAHLSGLLLHRHVLVHDTDTALLRHRNGQAGLGHGIHGGRHQWDIQANPARQLGAQIHILGKDIGVGGDQQNIIKGEGFLNNSHGCIPRCWLLG